MEEFKKDLLSMSKRTLTGTVIFLVIALIAAFSGIAIHMSECDTFNPYKNTGYVSLDFTVLYGPFAQKSQNGDISSLYYAAEGSDGYLYVLKTGSHCKYPVYGEDVGEDDFDSLPVVTAIGSTYEIESRLASYLVDYFRESGLDVNSANYQDYFGKYYIDTTDTPASTALYFYLGATVSAIIAVVFFLCSDQKKKQIKKKIELLEHNGQLNEIYTDFSSSNRMFSKKLKLAVSPHFVLDFNAPGSGFNIIPLENVDNVFKCNMLNGRPTVTNYIAMETNTEKRYVVAPSKKITEEFEAVISQLKNLTTGGTL